MAVMRCGTSGPVTSPELIDYLDTYSKFPGIAQVFRIHRHVEHYRKGIVTQTTDETVVGFTSLSPQQADAKAILRLNRGHWSIESNHWMLDSLKTWQEDHLLIRKDNGPENLSALRRFAIAVIKRHSTRVAATMRKLRSNVRMVLDYLGLSGNTRRRQMHTAKCATA